MPWKLYVPYAGVGDGGDTYPVYISHAYNPHVRKSPALARRAAVDAAHRRYRGWGGVASGLGSYRTGLKGTTGLRRGGSFTGGRGGIVTGPPGRRGGDGGRRGGPGGLGGVTRRQGGSRGRSGLVGGCLLGGVRGRGVTGLRRGAVRLRIAPRRYPPFSPLRHPRRTHLPNGCTTHKPAKRSSQAAAGNSAVAQRRGNQSVGSPRPPPPGGL